MREHSDKWREYQVLREEVLRTIPDNIDVFSIKREFQALIKSKRRFERIQTIPQLVEVTLFYTLDNTLHNTLHNPLHHPTHYTSCFRSWRDSS